MELKVKEGGILARFEGQTTCQLGAQLIFSVLLLALVVVGAPFMVYSIFTSGENSVKIATVAISDWAVSTQPTQSAASPTVAKATTVASVQKYAKTALEGVKKWGVLIVVGLVYLALFAFSLVCVFVWVRVFTEMLFDGSRRNEIYFGRVSERNIWTHTALPVVIAMLSSLGFGIYYDGITFVSTSNIVMGLGFLYIGWSTLFFLTCVAISVWLYLKEEIQRYSQRKEAVGKIVVRATKIVDEVRRTKVGDAGRFTSSILRDFYDRACRRIVVESPPAEAK